MKGWILAAAVALLTASASAEQRWVKATSKNFEVYTTAGEKKAREVTLRFEQVHELFDKESHPVRSSPERVRIVVFQSSKEYKPYQLFNRPAYAAGGQDHDEIVLGDLSVDYYPIVTHEYVHILLRPIKNVPVWLNEGMAELYSNLYSRGKGVSVGDPLPGRIALLNSSNWLDLETLCAVDHKSPYYTNDHSKVSVFYAESWALTHMLALSEPYKSAFLKFEALIFAGTQPAEAFRMAFGKQMREVMSDLRLYTQRPTLPGRIFDVNLEKSAENPEIRPATALESGLILATLLADLNRMDEAKQAYGKLAAENPSSADVSEALGYLAWRKQNMDEARAHFAKAVELGSRSPRVYYNYCAMAGGAGVSLDEQIAALKKAVELDPAFEEARLQLLFRLLARSEYKDTLAQAAHFKNIEPEYAFAFLHAVAYAAYRSGDRETARASAKRAAEVAKDATERAQIKHLQDQIEEPPRERLQAATPASERHAFERPNESEDDAPPPVRKTPQEQKPAPAPKTLIVQRPVYTAVEGTMDQIDCLGNTARLRITSAKGLVKLLIDKPNAIEVRGANAGTFDLTCGPQKQQRKVRVEYEPKVDAARGTIGLVRVMEMK